MVSLLPVKSSMLAAIGYDPASRTFAARYKSSNYVVHHVNVPAESANPVLEAARIDGGSVGRAFNEHIRGKFDYTQIPIEDEFVGEAEHADASA